MGVFGGAATYFHRQAKGCQEETEFWLELDVELQFKWSIQEEVLVFEKVEVKKGSGVSVLSQGIREKGVGGKKKWLEGLTCDDLPNAFDNSDDED
jgi:hypothetical protein